MGIVKNYIEAEKVQFTIGGLAPMTIEQQFRSLKAKKNKLRQQKTFRISQTKYLPKEISYENMIGRVHNQQYGTCFAECATTVVENWLWMRTGQKISFSIDEIDEIAADSKGSSLKERQKNRDNAVSGGHAYKALVAIYNFNSNTSQHAWVQTSDLCKKFKDLIDTFPSNREKFFDVDEYEKDQIITRLVNHGPFCISLNWKGNQYAGHAVTVIAADEKNVYFRNSHGSITPVALSWDLLDGSWGHRGGICGINTPFYGC